MSKKDGRDYLYLIWKNPISRQNFIVGQLSKNNHYEFSYGHEINKAIKEGFELLIPFLNIDEIYKSDVLFPAFSSRLPDSKRRGIEKILEKYDLKEFDEYKLLKRSGAKLPIDSLEFIDPILEEDNGIVKRRFDIAGVRYYIGCKGEDCIKSFQISEGDKLRLELEPDNSHDKNAVKIFDKDNNHIGYLPRYYSESITEHINNGATYECHVVKVAKNNECHECIKVKLDIYIGTKYTQNAINI